MSYDPGKYPIFPPRPMSPQAPVPLDYAPREPEPAPTGLSGIRLFRLFGVTVYLHWSWFLVAVYEIQQRRGKYESVAWNIAEYVALFAIVLMHEFGHALACRSVGGRANQITLWPLGGIAYVNPPPRPGATLWSIAAGPLVNVLLLPITWMFYTSHPATDLELFCQGIFITNLVLLVFNMLPIYPLDGGQILQSILWFFVGRARSLMIAAWIGLVCAGGLMLLALYLGAMMGVVLAAFAGMTAWNGLKRAKLMLAYGIRE